MIKTEIMCESCDSHFIVVTKDEESEVVYCPMCSAIIQDTTEDDDE